MVSRGIQNPITLPPKTVPRSPDPKLALLQSFLRGLSRSSPELAARAARLVFARPMRHRRSRFERELLARASEHISYKNGLRGASWGAGEESVLLVHGWSGRGTQLGSFVDPLVERGFRVVTFDAPGHGDSPGSELNPSAYANAMVQVAREMGPFRAVIGHSFGAASSVAAMERGLPVERAVLLASPSSFESAVLRFGVFMGLDGQVSERVVELLAARVGIHPRTLSVDRTARNLEQRALVMHDPYDDEVPYSEALEIVEAWEGAQLRRATGAGHHHILRDPSVVRTVVDFVSSPDPRPKKASPTGAADDARSELKASGGRQASLPRR